MLTSTPGQVTKPVSSKMRWVICALLFWVTTANYIDRSVFGNLAPEMPNYLHLSDRVTNAEVDQYWKEHATELAPLLANHAVSQDIGSCPECQQLVRKQIAKKSWDQAYWNMQMLFSAAYAISMLIMGRLMDVLGLRWGFAIACAFWGLASMSHAIAPEIGNIFGNPVIGFFICRTLLGLGEGANFPAAIKTTAEWFPKRERAFATGLFNSGSNLGGLLAPWALPFIIVQLSTITLGGTIIGWRGAFILTAVLDLGWIIVWLMFYNKPRNNPRVSEEELALIESDGQEPVVKIAWKKLIPHRQTWAITGAKLVTDGFWWFYLFGSPDFFNRRFALSLNDRKYMIMMIYVIASVGSIAGGWLAGKLMSRGWTLNRARKGTLVLCAACVVPVFYSAFTPNKWVAAILITLAASGHQAWSANVLSLVGDMFPRRVVGSVCGFAGMVSSFGSMALFYITGRVLSLTGNYIPIFILASLAYPLGLLIIHLLAPNLDPADIDEEKKLRKQLRKMATVHGSPIS